jgi:3-oxoacyl-[acyl-carrier protein] reductase
LKPTAIRKAWDIGGFADFLSKEARYTVIVAGASSGIGAAAARYLGALGVTVCCLGRNGMRTEATAAEIRDLGGSAASCIADLTELDMVQHAIRELQGDFGPIHGAINCAAISGEAGIPLHRTDLHTFETVCRTNLYGAAVFSKALIEVMLPLGYGRIVHVSSMAGKEGNAGMAAYSASKAGLIGLVKALGKEYATSGVTINALAPGLIRTPMVEAMPETVTKTLLSKIPMGRPGELAEVSATLAWMVSPACSFTTGFCFDLSGGRSTY